MVGAVNKGPAVERLRGVHIGSAADTAVVVDNSSAVKAVVVRLGKDPRNDFGRMGFGDHCLMGMDTVPPVVGAQDSNDSALATGIRCQSPTDCRTKTVLSRGRHRNRRRAVAGETAAVVPTRSTDF